MISVLWTMLSFFVVACLGEMDRQINLMGLISSCSSKCSGSSDEKGCWSECMGPYYGRREMSRQINLQWIISSCSSKCSGSSDEKGCWSECMGPYYGRREMSRQINLQWIISSCSSKCSGSSDEKGCWSECMGPYYGRREFEAYNHRLIREANRQPVACSPFVKSGYANTHCDDCRGADLPVCCQQNCSMDVESQLGNYFEGHAFDPVHGTDRLVW